MFSVLINLVLTLGVLVCVLAKLPFIHRAFVHYLNTWHDGVYITNISQSITSLFLHRCPDDINLVNNKMFGQLTSDETDAARLALAASKSADRKEFNLDIAKLLFVPPP